MSLLDDLEAAGSAVANAAKRGDGWGAAGAALEGVSAAANTDEVRGALGVYAPMVSAAAGAAGAALPVVRDATGNGPRRPAKAPVKVPPGPAGKPAASRLVASRLMGVQGAVAGAIQRVTAIPVTERDITIVQKCWESDPRTVELVSRVLADPNAGGLHGRFAAAIAGTVALQIRQLELQLAALRTRLLASVRPDAVRPHAPVCSQCGSICTERR